MNFFLQAPQIDPSEYLSPTDVQKIAAVRLSSPPSVWQDEVVQNLIRQHPFIPPEKVVVNFKEKDDAQGTAFGYVGIAGCPHISIPIIIKRRELAPLDILVRRANDDAGTDQGIGDMTEDKVMPLTEETFEQAMDTGSIGEPISDQKTQGTGYTEDGSALRLPFRGRTVIASLMGASPEKLEEFKSALAQNKQAQTGFVIHSGSEDVVNSWLNAGAPRYLVQSKLAGQEVKRATAQIFESCPNEISSSEFVAGNVILSSGAVKQAAAFDAIDLANPSRGLHRYLVYNDGGYTNAPEKVATFKTENPSAIERDVFTKLATGSIQRNMVVSFVLPDNVLSAPAKIASILINDQHHTIQATMLDSMLRSYNVMLSPAVKVAVLDEKTATWIVPISTRVLSFGQYIDDVPMSAEKVADRISNELRDQIVCKGGQYTLTMNNQTFVSQCGEAKIAAVLNKWFDNGDVLLNMVKEAGMIRFRSNFNESAEQISKLASGFNLYPELARKAVEKIAIPMKLAVKLAASIGSSEGVDAILGAGFLNEDNLSEFVSLADEFDDTVSKLCRLLLAVRMGFPGDESATMVAMKALQRVAERLKSAVQEVGL